MPGDLLSSLAPLGAPSPGNVLSGRQVSATNAETLTIVTVPAGRTWRGVIGASVAIANEPNVGLGVIIAEIKTAGTGVVPAAGVAISARAAVSTSGATALNGGQNGQHTGAVPFVVVAPVGNAVTITLTCTINGSISNGQAQGWAHGVLL